MSHSDDQREHIENLAQTHWTRLWELEQKEALYGINTPSEVLIEIKQIRKKIANLERKIGNDTSQQDIHETMTSLEQGLGEVTPRQIPPKHIAYNVSASHPGISSQESTSPSVLDAPPTIFTPNISLPEGIQGQQEEQKWPNRFGWLLLVFVNFILAIYSGWYWLGVLPNTFSYIWLISIVIDLLLMVFVVFLATRQRRVASVEQKSPTQMKAIALRQILTNYYDDNELRTLCFDLGIDYESLPAQGKGGKARELVAYAGRHGCTDVLVAKVRLRPGVAWPNVDQTIPLTRVSTSRWFKIGIPRATTMGLVLLLIWIYGYGSPTFDFENGANPGWGDVRCEDANRPGWRIRWEGTNCLGESVSIGGSRSLHFGSQALAFQFDLHGVPFDKAQMKYEVPNLRLDKELSGWVFVPDNAPMDLLSSCLVLEHNTTLPNQPEYLFFQTGYTKLVPGQWSYVRCLPSDFVSVNPGVTHFTNPLLAGFEVKRASNGFYRGVAYFDDIVLR